LRGICDRLPGLCVQRKRRYSSHPLRPRCVRRWEFWRIQRNRQEVIISFAARSGAVMRQLVECSIS
jgi:hypothetical protein